MLNLKNLMKSSLLVLVFSVAAFSQGSIKGIISDSLSSEPLAGANIFIHETSYGSATDIDGYYRVTSIPEGSYILEVAYIGYKPKQMAIEINEDENLTINFEVAPDVIEGEVISITAQAEGQIAAINQQINSSTIVNIVSEEKIKELPDANAAEAIGRLPGVSLIRAGGEANKVVLRGMKDKFTAITIDGVRVPATDQNGRGVDLSMISQSSLAGIELAKAVTPDKDGDALAGSIDMISKKAPKIREVRTNFKGNYNDLMESTSQYDLSVHYGERFFDDILGVQMAGNLEKKIRSNEEIHLDDRYESSIPDYRVENFEVEFTNEVRKRNGFSVLFDINTPDDGTIKINNVYGATNRNYLWHFRDYPLDGSDASYNFRQRVQNINTINSSIRGENHLFGHDINWGLSFAESKSEFPFDYQLTFEEGNPLTELPSISSRDYKDIPDALIPFARNDFATADLAWGSFRDQDNYEKERTAYFNVKRNYNLLNNLSGEIKIGAKYKVKGRTNKTAEDFTPYHLEGKWKTNQLRYVDGDTLNIPKDYEGSYFEEWYNAGGGSSISLDHFFSDAKIRDIYGSYNLSPLIIKERLKQWHRLNKNGVDPAGGTNPEKLQLEVWDNPLYRSSDYDISEHVSAFYIMNTLKLGQDLTFISGLRTEHEYNDYKAFYMKGKAGGFPLADSLLFDTTSTAQQTVFLPNFHLAYNATDYLKIRLAAYKALARPDFNMRVDRYIGGRGAILGSDFVAEVGNPSLKTASAWNFEFNTSFYGNNVGLMSVSVFYKEIDNMFHMLNRFGTRGARGDSLRQEFGIGWDKQFDDFNETSYLLSVPYNSKKPTKVWGLEFEHQINFHFLPGYLKNIVLSYNASIVRSETYAFAAKKDSIWDPNPPGFPPGIGAWDFFNSLVERKNKLEGQPEFFGNISLGYDLGGFSGRLSVFYQAEYNQSYSARSYSIRKSFTRIDLALKQQVTDNFALFLNVNNLTDAEEGSFNFNENIRRFNRSERYGATIDFGILGTF
ncbi:MAG: TonB-dependent receptor [Calditrichaeota bacterium]|nr:TonB-dependent receptor [Calditrichota bacterium]